MPTTLNAGHMANITRLNEDSGATFDKDFLKVQRDGHDDAVKELEKYSKDGDTPALKDFAQRCCRR